MDIKPISDFKTLKAWREYHGFITPEWDIYIEGINTIFLAKMGKLPGIKKLSIKVKELF